MGGYLTRCLVLLAVAIPGAAGAIAETPAEQLDRAAELFGQQNYEQAQRELMEIDRDQLTDEQKQRRDELVEEVVVAINQSNRAAQNIEDAERALEATDSSAAERLFRSVQDNAYATAAQKQRAREGLALVARQRELERQLAEEQVEPPPSPIEPAAPEDVPPVPAPAPAPVGELDQARAERHRAEASRLIAAGDEALERAQYGLAEQRFHEALRLVPGHPAALRGLELVRQHRAVEELPGPLAEVEARRRVRMERTETLVRQSEAEIRGLINERQFAEARERLASARQLLEAGRRDFEPPERYTLLASSLDALARFIDAEQRIAEEAEALAQRREAIRRQREREMLDLRERDQLVGQLMDQAMQLRRERRYEAAADVLREILTIDPGFERAEFLLDAWQEANLIQEQKLNRRELRNRFQEGLTMAERARTPELVGRPGEIIVYPDEDEWRMIAQRDPFGLGLVAQPEAERIAYEQLGITVPSVEFAEGSTFEEVIIYLRNVGRISIDVNWNALGLVGIDRFTDTQGIELRDVRLETALELLLDNVGGAVGVELSYHVVDGVVRISTLEDLNRKTFPRVYDVRDLLLRVRSFRAPQGTLGAGGGGMGMGGMMGGGMGGMGGGMMGGGMGGGMMGGGMGGGMMGGGMGGGGGGFGGDDDDDAAEEARREQVAELEDLIKTLIEPGTWEPEGIIGSLQIWNDRLIVRHTAGTHRQLVELFRQLREAKDMQVMVEARFVTMTSNFLEEIGVDLDVILNNGNAGFDTALSDVGRAIDPLTGASLLQPRRFSRLGFTPQVPAMGVPMGQVEVLQPYTNVALVPQGQPGNWWSRRTTPVPIMNNTLALAQPVAPASGLSGDIVGQAVASPAFQMFGSFLDNLQVDFLMRATQLDVRSSVVEAPRLVVYNGRRSFINVGTTQSFVFQPGFLPAGGTGVGGQAAAGLNPTIGTGFSGRTLDVTPTVSGDRKYVTLELRPNIQTFSTDVFPGATGDLQLARTESTTINTTVAVPDGGTILLGGLKLAGETEVEAGVPILSKIPIFKRAFTNRSRVKDERILLILVRPTIIIPDEQEERAFPGLTITDTVFGN